MEKKFQKNDNGFICKNCGSNVPPLGYTSRDHCNQCLCSLHVDKNPGDRKNECKGLLVPVQIETSSKKGTVIVYQCNKCGMFHKNKAAQDDNFETILSVANGTYAK
jgi:hypothetical protein